MSEEVTRNRIAIAIIITLLLHILNHKQSFLDFCSFSLFERFSLWPLDLVLIFIPKQALINLVLPFYRFLLRFRYCESLLRLASSLPDLLQ